MCVCVYVGGGNMIVSSHLHSLYLCMQMNVYAFVLKLRVDVYVFFLESVKGNRMSPSRRHC